MANGALMFIIDLFTEKSAWKVREPRFPRSPKIRKKLRLFCGLKVCRSEYRNSFNLTERLKFRFDKCFNLLYFISLK